MAQYQAGFILESVRNNLINYSKKNHKQAELNGLLRYLSTFNVRTEINLEIPTNTPSILAVATNIITRGLPTFSSIQTEEYYENALSLTKRFDNEERGVISFPFLKNENSENVEEILFKALHIIDPRAKNRLKYLNLSDLDSNFEKNFLQNYIPIENEYLTQLLERQRARESFTRDNNIGRVDFSTEIPYDLVKTQTNRYNSQVQLRNHKTYIAEIDGARYHTDLIDDLKDFEIAQLSTQVKHITEERTYDNVNDFIKRVTSEDFIRLSAENFNSDTYLNDPLTALVLSPLGVARVQRVMLQYLMVHYNSLSNKDFLKVAVIERDIPCSHIAFEDLKNLLETLNNLSETKISIPKFELSVFCSDDFINHPLYENKQVALINTLNPSEYDLIIDVSILIREGIFKDDYNTIENLIQIRSPHYIHYKTSTGVLSANSVAYRSLVNQLQNEIFVPIEDTSSLLRQLLQDIFRKIDFRVGQLPILDRALQLKSVIGLLPTGGGKSLTYQLAGLLQPGTTIVIDPIRSLMIDQFNGLKEIGIDKCEFINSTQSTSERIYAQNYLLSKGQLHFIFVSPERFVIKEFRNALDIAINSNHFFSYAVIDEVHCVSEWGHDFRTPYLNLGDNAQEFCKTFSDKVIPLFGLTATASFDVLADIERELNIKEDDGNAIVRFENSIRDEINYIINEVHCSYEGLNNLNEKGIREIVGSKKQELIFNLIENKGKILNTFNNLSAIKTVIEHSFNEYIPYAEKLKLIQDSDNKEDALEKHIAKTNHKILLPNNPFTSKNEFNTKIYEYGIIAFMPHRHGWLGVKSNEYSFGFYDNPSFRENIRSAETLGYFMGSSDEQDSERIDIESFEHLASFKNNEESVMVATKAFGMGIDKPNIRMTVHINIPQSIESFVQEAGRAGRDGKISTSIILYNNDTLNLTSRPKDLFHLDKDVLMYFHKNSFKGQIKERVIIYELRTMITFPNTNNLQLLTTQLNDFFATNDIEFNLKLGRNNYVNRIFINTNSGTSIGCVYLDSKEHRIYRDLGNDALCHQITEWLKNNLPFNEVTGVENIRTWLTQLVVNTQYETGIEILLTEMNIGETKSLPIPFTNRYYSKRTNIRNEFRLNDLHLKKVFETQGVKMLIQNTDISTNTITNLLKDAVYSGSDYPDFIESLKIKNENLLKKLLDNTDPISLELQKAYFIPRAQDDTAKAIYRLVSIGIIDSYTIDYQNKLYYIHFTKKTESDYYSSLKDLIARYTSKNVANREIEKLKIESEKEIASSKATIISKCLEFLTDFIYSKIKEKRLQAIFDMISLCQTSITIEDPLEQNKYIKDEIYYYFNAKYSRRNFVENTKTEDIDASMPDDLDNDLPIDETIKKYMMLVGNEDTGEFISNIKHLRGSTMRMLRSNPDKPQFRILKSFSLFILADSIKELINEAKHELVTGLIYWKQNEDTELNVQHFIHNFKNEIMSHVVNHDIEKVFNDIEDHYYALFYANWTLNFNNKFLKI